MVDYVKNYHCKVDEEHTKKSYTPFSICFIKCSASPFDSLSLGNRVYVTYSFTLSCIYYITQENVYSTFFANIALEDG